MHAYPRWPLPALGLEASGQSLIGPGGFLQSADFFRIKQAATNARACAVCFAVLLPCRF